MPKLGSLTRTIALVALAGAVAAVAAGAAGAHTKRHAGTTITGAGSTFVSPLVCPVDRAARFCLRLRAPVQRRRLGCGHHGDHLAHRRLRRERRAAELRPVRRLQRLRSDPVGFGRHLGHVQPARRQEPPSHGRADARQHLHGQDHDLERPGDREAQQGRQPARARRSRSRTARTTRARRSTSPTTSRTSARPGSRQIGTGVAVNWPVGSGGKGSAGVAALVDPDAGLDRLRRRRSSRSTTTSATSR